MSRSRMDDAIVFLQRRIEESYEKILDETIEWKDKERYYVRIQEDIPVLEKLLNEKVVIKTRVEW